MSSLHPWVVCAAALAVAASCRPLTSNVTGCEATGCPAGATCDSETRRCLPTPTDAGCSIPSDCAAPTPVCAEDGACVECLVDADCPTGLCDTGARQCFAQPDTCATARLLDLSSGQAEVHGNTGRAADDMRGSCALPSSTGPDLVFRFTLADSRRVQAVATPSAGSALQPVLALRRDCAATAPADNLGCAFAAAGETAAKLGLELRAGTYWLWVDGDGDTAGEFDLSVTAEVPAPGDSCGNPTLLVTKPGTVGLTGDTRGAQDDAAGSCGGQGGLDQVYQVQLTVPSHLTAVVTPVTAGYLPLVYLRRAPCTSQELASQLGCSDGKADALGAAQVDVPRLEPGSYFLFVDGALALDSTPTEGAFQLAITAASPLGTPSNDTCPGAIPIDPPVGGYGSFGLTSSTGFAVNDSAGCGGSGPDVVYALRVPGPRRLSARVKPTSGSALIPVVYLRAPDACDSELAQDQLGCNAAVVQGGTASIVAPNVAAGNYFLWIDGANLTKGDFELTVELSAPIVAPANDDCAAPQGLAPGAGPVTVIGTTTGAAVDTSSTCVATPAGPDVVYELTVATQQSLALDLQAAAGSQLLPALVVRPTGACASTALSDELVCVPGDAQVPDRAVFNGPSMSPGTYFVWVEGQAGSHGPFSLRAALGPVVPAPVNDDCASAIALQAHAAVTGDTRAALNDSAGQCGGLAGRSGENARDVVYQLNLATAQTVTLTVLPDAADGKLLRPVLYVRGPGSLACESTASADQKGCEAATAYGGEATMTLQSLPAGTYWVWVDGAAQSSGKFTLKWQ